MFAAIWTRVSLALLLAVSATGASAASCDRVIFEQTRFTICNADPAEEDVRLFYRDDEGRTIGTFQRLGEMLADEGRFLTVAMNGGMYHPDRRPVGLYIEDGDEIAPLVTREGPGNFGLLPNGVLCLTEDAARIVESRTFAEDRPECRDATQSGPMLVIGGALHPRFLPNSDSLYVRNGAGVRADGTLVLAISDAPVNFHRFGRLFRDVLDTPDALYLDGNVSKLHAANLGRSDLGLPMGPILAVTAPAD